MRKAINFDLDTHRLEENYGDNWRNAYTDIRRFMEENHFEHRQGSGYVSSEDCSKEEIHTLLYELTDSFSWFEPCIQRIDVTSVGKQYDVTAEIHAAKDEIDLLQEHPLIRTRHR
jgi:cell filamentation protein